MERVRKARKGKECAGKSVPLFVYRYSIIEKRNKGGKGAGKDMFIIYRYIERSYKQTRVLSANIRLIYKTYVQMCTYFPHVCVYFQLNI